MCRNKSKNRGRDQSLNKGKILALSCLVLCFTTSACGSSEKLLTDTGSGSGKELSREEYLDVDALQHAGEESTQNNYKVYTLEKGTYTEKALNQTLERAFINAPVVRLEMEEGTAEFEQYVASSMLHYVETGDVIATVHTEVDELTIEETEVKLLRLQERCKKAEEKLAEVLEDLRVERTLIYNDYERAVIDIRCKQLQLDWEKQNRSYEREIEDTRKSLEDLKKISQLKEITAPLSGYVVYALKYMPGSKLKDGDYICTILTSDDFYVQTDNQSERYEYGMQLDFRSMSGLPKGSVISAGSRALYGNLDTGNTTFLVDFGEEMTPSAMMQINKLVMEGNMKTVENVVLVPGEAVTVEDDSYYVTVLKEDGSLLKTEFIPGGGNAEQYWVYEGLTEGTQVVY